MHVIESSELGAYGTLERVGPMGQLPTFPGWYSSLALEVHQPMSPAPVHKARASLMNK